MRLKFTLNIIYGIASEILYALLIILAAFLLCLVLYPKL